MSKQEINFSHNITEWKSQTWYMHEFHCGWPNHYSWKLCSSHVILALWSVFLRQCRKVLCVLSSFRRMLNQTPFTQCLAFLILRQLILKSKRLVTLSATNGLGFGLWAWPFILSLPQPYGTCHEFGSPYDGPNSTRGVFDNSLELDYETASYGSKNMFLTQIF